MKKFTNKKFMQKLIIAIVSVIMLNFCITPPVQASFGGTLMSMMIDFSTAIADVVGALVQFGVTGKWIDAVDGKGSGKVVVLGTADDGTEGYVDAEGEQRNTYWVDNANIEYPILQVSPELIFANEIELLDANFITGSSSEEFAIELEDDAPLETLRKIIASWYVTLRTIAVVGLLSVLIYIGIRIIISSTSADKAKYKQRLMDWVVAFCLLFFMHYIMAATLTVVGQVNNVLAGMTNVEGGLKIKSEYGGIAHKSRNRRA